MDKESSTGKGCVIFPTYIPHRTFVFSSELFDGFRAYVDIRSETNIDSLISSAVSQLCQSLQRLNLTELVRRLRKTKFHIHDVTMGEILISPIDKVYYVCD